MNQRIKPSRKPSSADEVSRRIVEAMRTKDNLRIWKSLAEAVHAATSDFIDGDLHPTNRDELKTALKSLHEAAERGDFRAFLAFHRRHGFVGRTDPLVDLAIDQIGLTAHVLHSQYGCPPRCLSAFAKQAAAHLLSMSKAIGKSDDRTLAISLDRYLDLARKIAAECVEV